MFKAVCSQCGTVFRAKSRSKLLDKIRRHNWSKHRAWMRDRIKSGLEQAKHKSNPRIIGALEAPIIEKLTGQPYEKVKSGLIDFFKGILIDVLTRK